MKENNEPILENGVTVPQDIVESSEQKKRRHRTLRQLPLYRDMANLKYLTARLYEATPRKMTKFLDVMLGTVAEAKKCVGLGEASRIPEERAQYLSMARIFIEDVQDDVTILRQMNHIGKQTEKRMKSLTKSIVAQCIAWRDYTNAQGNS